MGGVNRRILTLVVALVPIVAFALLLSVVTVPYVALGPGPTFNTLGEVDGKQVVDIKSTDGVAGDVVHPTSGHLNMTTVSQRDGLTMGQALILWMSGRDQLVPRDLVYPPDKSKDDIDEYVAVLRQISKEAYEDPELVKSAPHNQVVHKVPAPSIDEPERIAVTWRAYQKKKVGR